MSVTFDPAKRAWKLQARGLDFVDAALVFSGPTIDFEDRRKDYGEMRMITVGSLRGRFGRRGVDAPSRPPPRLQHEESQ